MAKVGELTAREAAQQLGGVSLHHLYELIWTGKVAARRVDGRWMIPTTEVEARRKQMESRLRKREKDNG